MSRWSKGKGDRYFLRFPNTLECFVSRVGEVNGVFHDVSKNDWSYTVSIHGHDPNSLPHKPTWVVYPLLHGFTPTADEAMDVCEAWLIDAVNQWGEKMTYSEDEVTKIKKSEAAKKFRKELAVFVLFSVAFVFVLLCTAVMFASTLPTSDQQASLNPTSTPIVVTATPTAAPVIIVATPTAVYNEYQAHLPDAPLQTVLIIGERELVGRVGYLQHDGADWRYFPYCTAVLSCRWPMQPPNETYSIFVEYGGRMTYIQADPLDVAVEVYPWLVVEEALP